MSKIYMYEPLFGSWQVEKRLGAGGFGEVYKIRRESLGITQYAAVKLISIPDDKKNLLELVKTEIQTMLDMQGANHIVRIEEYAEMNWLREEGKDILIRMELLASLDSIIKKSTLTVDETVKLGIHICKALELCESRKILHRDIKPGNILVSGYGEYKLSDFGIARSMEGHTFSRGVGTDDFMAPEVFGMFGKYEYDSRADIYSLGITLYYLLNQNMFPFEDIDSQSHFLRRRSGEVLPPPRNTPDWLVKVVLKACAYKPEDRYANAIEMRAALEQSNHGIQAALVPQEIAVNIPISDEKLIPPPYSIDNTQMQIKQEQARQSKGLCPQCGSKLSGIFTKKCKQCGYPNKPLVDPPAPSIASPTAANRPDTDVNPHEYYRQGMKYLNGLSVPKDEAQARRWLYMAAKRGHIEAQYEVGLLCMADYKGRERKVTEAFNWFIKAAEHGHLNAQYQLGHMYYIGVGIPRNYTQAFYWMSKAAEHGHSSALRELDAIKKQMHQPGPRFSSAVSNMIKPSNRGKK